MDANQLVFTVESTHPFFGQELIHRLPADYVRTRDEFMAYASRVDNDMDFIFEAARYLRVLRDSHTSNLMTMLPRIPNSFTSHDRFIVNDNRLYSENVGAEIIAIGGVCVQEIFDVMDIYFGFENEACRRYHYAAMAGSLEIHRRAGVVITNDAIPATTFTFSNERGTWNVIRSYTNNGPQFMGDRGGPYNYNIRHEMMGDVFYLHLRQFMVVQPEHDQTMAAIRQAVARGQKNFIIDLRYNGGGGVVGDAMFEALGITWPNGLWYTRISQMLRQHNPNNWWFTQNVQYGDLVLSQFGDVVPRNPHGVTIAVLMNNQSYSAAVDFARRVQDGGFGVIIGEPSRNAPSYAASNLPFQLRRTELNLFVSSRFSTRPDEWANQQTLHPDIFVPSNQALETALEYFANLSK